MISVDEIRESRSGRANQGSRYHPQGMKRQRRILVLPKSYFLEQVRLERLRADRSTVPVSMAVFRLVALVDGEGTDASDFLRQVSDQVRETDILGYLAEDAIGLLLPHTTADGARKLGEKIMSLCGDKCVSVRSATYPDQLFDELAEGIDDATYSYAIFLDDPAEARRLRYLIKRTVDIGGALLGLLLFFPLMLIAALAVRMDSPGPAIFKQVRLGRLGRPFTFYKLRSMTFNSDDKIHREYVSKLIRGDLEEINQGNAEKPMYKIKRDPRVTRVGAIIRKLSIDELPQLYNVLKGDMSLVGPRPPLPYETKAYQPWHLRRILEMKPGVTGLWQVSGRSCTSFDYMVRLDLRYIQNWSLWLDVKILLKTIKVVLWPRGAV